MQELQYEVTVMLLLTCVHRLSGFNCVLTDFCYVYLFPYTQTHTHTHTEEFTIYNAGLVPSMFYGVIDSRDLKGFKRVLWQSALAVASAAVVCWHVTARVCNLTLC